MSYSFDGGPLNGNKPHPHARMQLHFKKGYPVRDINYLDALYYNAEVVKDSFREPFDVFFSGGIDSEVVVRVNHDLGIKQNVVIIRMENDYNVQDVTSALRVCDTIGIKPTVIDWNLKRFIENDAYDFYQRHYTPVIGWMTRMAWVDLVDNIPVFCGAEPFWQREEAEYTKRISNVWKFHWHEDDFTLSLYGNYKQREIVGEWWCYTPEPSMSFHKLPAVKSMLQDQFPGMQNCWPLRHRIYSELWDNIHHRPKLVGYEGHGAPWSYPQFMLDFENAVMEQNVKTHHTRYKYTQQQLESIFNG
jgi:hypothetical protein